MRRGAGPRSRRHDTGHELKGRVPEATLGIAARGEARLFQDQQKGLITRTEFLVFLARALKTANNKARELGWIV